MKKKQNVVHHDSHRLNSIKLKIKNHEYDSLTEKEITFLSGEIESGKIQQSEVEQWMKRK